MMLTLFTAVALTTQTAGPSGPARDDFFLGARQADRAAGPTGPASAGGDVTRTYDVRALGLAVLRGDSFGNGSASLRLAPAAETACESENYSGNAPGLGDDRWINLFVDLLGRTVQAEGRFVAVRSDGQLVVTGPAELHESVTGLLGLIGGVAMEEGRLGVDVVRLTRAEADALGGVVVDGARAEALANGAIERFELALREDTLASYARTRSLPAVYDYQVEVASGAAISDPEVVESAFGTQLVVRAVPGRGGVHLALAVKRSDLVLGKRATGIRLVSRHVGDDGRAITSPFASITEDPDWTAASFATTCFLPEGGALVLLGANDGESYEALVLRLAAPVPGGFRSQRFADGGVVGLVHLGALAPPTVSMTGRIFSDQVSPLRGLRADQLVEMSDPGLLACELAVGDLGSTRDAILARLGRVDQWEVGEWLVVRGGTEVEALADAPRASARQLAVEVRLEHAGAVKRRARLPLLLGETAAVSLTREALDAVEADVEIAERSACTDPRMQHVFGGLVCAVKALPLADGRVVLDLAGVAQVMGARRTKVLDDEFVPALEERDLERLGLRSRRVLSAGADGVFRAVVGAVSGDGLRVVVTLTPVEAK